MVATDFRRQAACLIWPAVKRSALHPDAKALYFEYLGLDDLERPTLKTPGRLTTACLTRTNQNARFCRMLTWAFVDPASKEWIK